MSTTSTVLQNIAAYCAATGIAETTFGKRILNDGKFVPRLRAGGTMTLKTLEKVETALAALPMRTIPPNDSENSESCPDGSEFCSETSGHFPETRKEVRYA